MLSLLRPIFWLQLALILLPIPAIGQEPVDDVKIRAQVETFIAGFHDAAAAVDTGRYLGCFRKDAIILGTAPGERFGIDAFRSMALQAFSGGRGWKTVPFERNVAVSRDGRTAWFHERLHRESGMELRATGIRVHIARTTYRIAVKGFAAEVRIQPDHEVHPTVEDRVAGRDPETELALRLIREED
jgi:hypothetical protein